MAGEAPLLNTGPAFEPPEGFPFGRQSAIRRFTEPAIFLLYPQVAGMTVMNDRIANAVDEKSAFREHPYGRLASTIDSATVLVFGKADESLRMARLLYHFHDEIRSDNYNPNDGRLQAWVLACLFKGILTTNDRWLQPLSSQHQEDLYDDFRIFGKVFGVPAAALPKDVAELNTCWDAALNGDNDFLLQTDSSRNMTQSVFRFSSPKVPKPLARIAQAVSITSLDPRLQDRANLHPDKTDHRIAEAVDLVMRNGYGRVPSVVREQVVPTYIATRRLVAPFIVKTSLERRDAYGSSVV